MCPNCFCCRCKCGKKKRPLEKDKENAGEDTLLNDQPYRYLTVDEMKSLGDDSLPIDVTRDERTETQVLSAPPTADHDSISPLHASYTLNLTNVAAPDNVDIGKVPPSFGFLVSFLVDARGGAMRGCRHSGVRLIVPPRRAAAPTRVTCRYLRKDKLPHPPPLMEGEALASRILELGPVGAKFLGPVMIEVPHFASLRGSEREIVILRSDNGEAWREHTVESSEEVVQEILSHSFEKEDMPPPVETDPSRLTRILTLDFPHYFAVVSRVKQEVHAIGPEGGMVSSTVVPQVQAVFPQGALTKKIKVGLQAQPIPTDITAKLLGNRVAVSPIVTIEPRRRKFHKPITLTIPVPQAANKGMINQYSGDAPTLRLLCSITGGTARAQWEDVTGTTPLTFVKDCVSFTTTVSARFWLMDCRNVQDSAKMATELYREAIHVPFLAKFVVFAKRIEELEARVSVFCMTDDKEDKTLEHQEHFTEVAKSRDVEVLEGKSQFVEFTGNLVPVTKSGDQLRLGFRAFRENRLPFTVRVKDPHADVIGRTLFMREPKVSKGEAPQQPICVLNIVLPEDIIPETSVPESELTRYQYLSDSRGLESYHRSELRLPDISNHLENDWIPLASSLGISNSDISKIQADHPDNESQQALAMLRLWMRQSGNTPTAATLESALVNIGREDIIRQCIYTEDQPADPSSRLQGGYPGSTVTTFRTTEFIQTPHDYSTKKKDSVSDSRLTDHTDHGVTKYEIEEKNIIEEPSKPVAEHKREIEKRLSQERSSSLEKPEKKADELKMRTKIIEHVSLSETVSKDEPAPSFHEKRLSFERGSSQDRAKTDAFIQEEKKASGPSATVPEQVEAKVDEAAKLSFKEKRKSFEQGSLDKADKDDKKPKSDSNDKKPKSDSKKPDEKIPEAKDDPTTKAKPEKVTERKVVSETISKTVETIGDKKSIVSEKVTKTTEIKGDQKPVTTEVVTTTIHTAGDKKPVVSKTTTKIIEETDTVIIPGAKDTVDKSVSKPVVSETVTTVTKDSEIKTSVEPSKVKDIVKDTITKTRTESKPVDDIKVSVETAKEKPIVCETTTNVIKDIKSTDIKTLEISKDEPIISETITTIITDKKPSDQIRKTIEITESKPVFTETITTILTDQKPTDRTKTTETITKTVEPHVSEFKGTAEKVVSKTVVSDAVTTLTTDAKPTELSKTVVTTTTPLVSDIITTVQTESKAAVNEVITKESVPKDIQKTETKNIAPAVKAQEVIEVNKTAVKDDKPETFKDKLPSDVLDDICISESRVVSELITTKKTDGAPSVTKTTTEITTMSSESGKPDQTTTITEISVGKPDMTLEERRKSELFEGVTQGLLANVKNQDPKSKDIISPKLISTPPPSPADFKDATSASSPTTEQSWTSSDTKTTSSDKTAIFIEAERGTKPTDKPVQDSHGESETSSPKLKDQSECSAMLTEMRQEQQELSQEKILNTSFDLTIDTQSEAENDGHDYKTKKEFWEQLSSSSSSIEKEVPTPKPRSSISSIKSVSIERDSTKTLVTSPEVHTKEICSPVKSTSVPTTTSHVVQETTKKSFSRENTRGESLDSEMEYIARHPDILAFENSGFSYEDEDDTLLQSARMYDKRYSECLNEIPPIPCPRKTILERSTSLPCADLVTKESQVKQKKKKFEAQMRKETAVEQLEEEGSPERKSISLDQSLSSPDQEAILNRQIHSHIFTNEMDEQIDSLVPEEKIIQETADIRRLTEFFESRSIESKESLEKTDSQESSDDLPRSKIAEVMLYKSESISKPSDSLEVQIDKSDVDSTMKEEELDEDLKEIEYELQRNYNEDNKIKDSTKYSTVGEQIKLTEDNIAFISSAKHDNTLNNEPLYFKDKTKPTEDSSDLKFESKAKNTHSTIHTPEEHIPDTVWEVGVQSDINLKLVNTMPTFSIGKEVIIDNEEEYAEEFSFSKPVTIEKENITYIENVDVPKNEYDTSTIRECEPDDVTYSDTLESQITEQFELNSISKEEARNIAESVIEEIEQELVKRKDVMAHIEDQVFSSSLPGTNISDSYLKEFAEKENMDMKLIESVLAKKQRDQFKKLARNDTATSSMEITDEDLRSSGLETEITGESLAYRMSGIVETDGEEDLPRFEKSEKYNFDEPEKSKEYIKETSETNFETVVKPSETKEFEYKRTEENIQDDTITRESHEASITEKTFGEKDLLEKKEEYCKITDNDFSTCRTDTIHTDLLINSTDQNITNVNEKIERSEGDVFIIDEKDGASLYSKRESEQKCENITDERKNTSDCTEIKTHSGVVRDWQSELEESFQFDHKFKKESDTETLSKLDSKSKKDKTDEAETSYKIQTESIIDTGASKLISSSNLEKSHFEKSHKTEILDHSRTECKIEIRKEYLGDASMIEELEKAGFRISEDIREETSRLIKGEMINKETIVTSKTIEDTKSIETVEADDTKSTSTEPTVVSIKNSSSPEYQNKNIEGDLKSPIMEDITHEVIMRKHHDTSNKIDRKSGADYDQHSSSDGSHYLSSEQISEKSSKPSRPCSTDVDALIATGGGGSSEYESAMSHVSGKTSQTTNEYQTAVSSLSSRESMKSLNSESSGNLASVSETLIPSASDLDQDMDIDSIPEDKCSYQQILDPYDTDISSNIIRSGFPHIPHSTSQPFKTEALIRPTLTKSHTDGTLEHPSSQMKRSPEIALVADNSPLSESVDEKCPSSLDDVISVSASDATGIRTVIELSKTESERMEGSGTSEQHSLTVSATSGELSLSSESRDENILTYDSNVQHIITEIPGRSVDDSISLGEFSVDNDIKKKHGHRRNESQSFNSMIPVYTGHKKVSIEDVPESDKYVIKETEIDETDSEADQGLCRDIQEAQILKQALFETEKPRSNLPSYSSDDFNEEILNQLISSENLMTVDDIIARPKTPEPPDDICVNLKTAYLNKCDNISACSSSDMPLTERHHSTTSDHEDEFAEAEAAFHMVPHVSPSIPTHLPPTIPEDPFEENKELETREALLKEATMRKLAQADISPAFIPDITVTEHLTPLVDKGFKYPDLDLEAELANNMTTPDIEASIGIGSSTTSDLGQDYDLGEATKNILGSQVMAGTNVLKDDTDSPTSDSFEILETPDEMDDFVIVEEVAKEAEEKDDEGKSVRITKKRSVQKFDDDDVILPPKQPETKMIKVEYYGEKSEHEDEIGLFHLEDSSEKTLNKGMACTLEDGSLEPSPPTDDEHVYDKDAEARRKWIEMQFQGDPSIAAAYGYEMEFERGPLEDIKEEELTELDGSSKFGSVSSQVSQSIGSIGSFGKTSLSSTPDFDVLAGKKFFMRANSEQDNVSMSSLQEFERLEQLMALESMKARSSSSQDSMNSSGRSTSSAKKSSNSGELTSSSLKEFEGLERACIEAEKIEHKARAEELMLIEEGHESLTSESSSCVTITGPAKLEGDSDSENYEQRMFTIDEIIREAQSNVEQFVDIKTESIGRGDSLEEVSRIPDLEFDQPSGAKKDLGKKESEDDMVTSTDSLELKTAISRKELTTSTDSLEMKTNTGDPMSASTDSIEYHLKQKKDSKNNDFMRDSIEGTLPSLDTQDKMKYPEYAEDQSSSSGRDGDLSSSGKDDVLGEINRIPPPRSEQHLGSTDSIDPTSSTATHATYQYETDSLMSSSFTSGGSNTLMSSMEGLDNVTRTGVWFEDGRPYVTEVIEPVSDEEFSHTIHRTVELPPEVHKVIFSGPNAEEALKEYVERFGPGEDVSETKEIDSEGNVHIKRVVQRRVVVKPEEISSSEGPISSSELEEYLKKLGQEQRQEQEYYEFDQDGSDSFLSSPNNLNPAKSTTSSNRGLITEFESHEEPCSSQASRKKKEETSAEADSKKKADDATQK